MVLAAIAFVESAAGKRWLAREIERFATKRIRGSLSIGSIRGDLFRRVEVSDVRLLDGRGKPVALVASLKSEHLIRLFPPSVEIKSLAIERPRVFREVGIGGRSNWDDLFVEPEPAPGEPKQRRSAVELRTVFVHEASFRQEGPKSWHQAVARSDALRIELPDPVPFGRITATGDAGWLSYDRGAREIVLNAKLKGMREIKAIRDLKLDLFARQRGSDAQVTMNLVSPAGRARLLAKLRNAFLPNGLNPDSDHARGTLELEVDRLDLRKLRALGVPALGSVPERLEGVMSARARLDFDPARAIANGWVGLTPRSSATRSPPLLFQLALLSPPDRLLARDLLGPRDARIHGEVSVEGFEVSVGEEPASIRPRILASALVLAGGSLREPSLDARVQAASGFGSKLAPLAVIRASLRNGRLNALVRSDHASIDAAFAALAAGLETHGGTLDADLTATRAPGGELGFQGTIGLKARKARVPALLVSYHDIDLRLAGNRNHVDLERLSLRAGRGWARAFGRLHGEELGLHLDFEDFHAATVGQARGEITGKLDLSARLPDLSFRGNMEIQRGEIRIQDTKAKKSLESTGGLEDVTTARRTPAGSSHQAAEQSKPGLAPTSPELGASGPKLGASGGGTIHVHAPGRLWLESSEFAIELSTDSLEAGVRKDGGLFVTGQVGAKRGFAEFFGRHFEVRRAVADFPGDPSRPRIAAEAIYSATPYSILVSLQGVPPDFKVRLDSDPPGLSEDQSVGVLLTGSPEYAREGGGTTSPKLGASGGGAVSGAATGFLAGELKKKLGSKLPFDYFAAQLASEGEPASQAQLEVGKYLTDRLFVKLGRGFGTEGAEPADKFTLDYRVSNRWSLETSQTDRGRSDFDMLWTLAY